MDKTKICSQAILSNYGDMTSFRFGNINILCVVKSSRSLGRINIFV